MDKILRPDWHEYFFNLCDIIATRSEDQNTKVGALVIGGGKQILTTGYNSFPRGIENQPQRQERPEKYFWFAHAEENAIANAARSGVIVNGGTLYVQWVPCTTCARLIVQAGISEVIYRDDTPTHWMDICERSKIILAEGGVILTRYYG